MFERGSHKVAVNELVKSHGPRRKMVKFSCGPDFLLRLCHHMSNVTSLLSLWHSFLLRSDGKSIEVVQRLNLESFEEKLI
jgi:hypothetical protein